MNIRRQLVRLYSSVLMREIDSTLEINALRKIKSNTVDIDVARKQHNQLREALESIGLPVFTLPSKGYPDSVFIEDTCIVIKNTALITRPGAKSRRGEVEEVYTHISGLKSLKIHNVIESNVSIDGGDVLFTGSEIFVGVSDRTNSMAIQKLRDCFSAYPVIPINLRNLAAENGIADNPLHLKSFCSMCGENDILVGGQMGEGFKKWLEKERKGQYGVFYVPDEAAANCIYVNGTIIRRTSKEFPMSEPGFSKLNVKNSIQVEASELGKVDGALTCCVILLYAWTVN